MALVTGPRKVTPPRTITIGFPSSVCLPIIATVFSLLGGCSSLTVTPRSAHGPVLWSLVVKATRVPVGQTDIL